MHFLTSLSLLASTAVALPSLLERASPISGKNVTLMPLGDSITWGMTDPNSNGYRARLYSKLQTAGATPLDFIGSVRAGTFADPDNQGRIGYTVQQIASDAASVANLRPNVVLLHAGTNDALRQYQTSDKAISDLQKLVDQIFTQWPKTALILAKVVPCANNADNGQPTQPYLNAINAAVPSIVSTRASAGKKIISVDQSVLSTSELIDKIHPTVAGYEHMADIWFPGVETLATKGWL